MEQAKRPETMERITTSELAKAFIEEQVAELRKQIGDKKVLLALSGGVDSSVVAALLIKAVGQQLVCVHVNHGLLRKGEPEQVIKVFRDEMKANLIYVDATERFLGKLAGVWPASAIRKPNARSSAANLSKYLRKKRRNWKVSSSWPRVPFIRIFWKANRASRPITMWAACLPN